MTEREKALREAIELCRAQAKQWHASAVRDGHIRGISIQWSARAFAAESIAQELETLIRYPDPVEQEAHRKASRSYFGTKHGDGR